MPKNEGGPGSRALRSWAKVRPVGGHPENLDGHQSRDRIKRGCWGFLDFPALPLAQNDVSMQVIFFLPARPSDTLTAPRSSENLDGQQLRRGPFALGPWCKRVIPLSSTRPLQIQQTPTRGDGDDQLSTSNPHANPANLRFLLSKAVPPPAPC